MIPDRSDIPKLYGRRLTLEPLVAAHAPALVPLFADAELWRFTEDRPPQTVDGLRERFARLEMRHSPDGAQRWLNWALSTSDDGYVGFVQATVFAELAEAEIAYVIGRRFWSLGLGTEGVRVLLTFLAKHAAVKRVCATVDDRNFASLRLLQKLAFRVVDDGDRRNCRLERILAPDES